MSKNQDSPRKAERKVQNSKLERLGAENARLKAEKEKLVAEKEKLVAEKEKLVAEKQQLAFQLEKLLQKYNELFKITFGRKSEKLGSEEREQLEKDSRDPEEPPPPEHSDEAPDVEEARPKERRKDKKKRRGHGRRPLPAHLPRERVVLGLPASELLCPCCEGVEREPFADEVTEDLEFVPASFRIIEKVRPKYRCPKCLGNITCAALPQSPIDKGRPGPGLLAQVITAKYADHLPLHRLSGIFARDGVDLAKSTMGGWVMAVGRLLEPIVDRMVFNMKKWPVIGGDDTKIRVLDPEAPDGVRNARMWAFRGAKGDVVFRHTATKAGTGPANFLAGFGGYFQADAANNYDRLFADGRILEVGCWAHARRRWFKAKDGFPQAYLALGLIRKLYEIEAKAKAGKLSPEETHDLRQQKSRPLVEKFFTWLRAEKTTMYPGTLLADAVQYALNHEAAFRRFLENGNLSIDNNNVERALRQVAVGRKNWLFAGSEEGAHIGAILYSLVVSCKELEIDPWAYLRDVIDRISTHPQSEIDQLTPRFWRPRSES